MALLPIRYILRACLNILSRMKKLILISYLVALVFFAWGYAMVRYQAFPWQYFYAVEQDIIKYIQGGQQEKTSLTEKVANDLNVRPSRLLYEYHANEGRDYARMEMQGLKSRRQNPHLYVTDRQAPGFKFIYAAFDYEDAMHAGILLDENNEIVHRWVVDQGLMKEFIDRQNDADGGNRKLKPPNRRLPQGFEILPDGTMILAEGYQGNGMHRIDFCSKFDWSLLGPYHHIVALDETNGSVWGFGPGDITQVDINSGEILREFSIKEIHKANPEKSIFNHRRRISIGQWLHDPIHKNDIEVLSPGMASAFPMFEAGDLLIVHRSTSTVFVIDQQDLKIKWWRTGFVRRPHDADWQPDGTITVYDNNMREPVEGNDNGLEDLDYVRYSKIMRIDPASYIDDVLYHGGQDNFYSGARGVHQVLPNGNILITSPHQGRVLEVDAAGETVFEFVNTYDAKESLNISEARWFPLDYFDFDVTDSSICN